MTWTRMRAKYLYDVLDKRAGSDQPPLLAVSIHRGVVPRSDLTEDEPRADDLANYKMCEPGDIVLNRMRAFQGGIGLSHHRGIVSPDYMVLRPRPGSNGRFLHHLFRSKWFVGEMVSRLRGIGNTESGAVRTPRINPEDMGEIVVPVPSADEQRRIADFLDAETARIDQVLNARERQLLALVERQNAVVVDALSGASQHGRRKDSGLRWLGDVPASWPVGRVSAHYSVDLGKMLNQERAAGEHLKPYLRNTNVQWDRIDTHDLLLMDFPPHEHTRYRVLPGDLLVCEGGEPGRAAVWDGEIGEIYYQKALHRVRPRGRSSVRWLYYCLRAAAAMNVFAVEGNQTTIAHLTGEQLKAHRFPFPDTTVQCATVAMLDRAETALARLKQTIEEQQAILRERKQALITAAVTGQFDVTTGRGVDLS